MQPFLEQFLYGGIILILMLCGIGLPIPEEATFLFAGYAAAKVHADVKLLCVAGVVGIMLGDSIPFLLGKYYGLSLLKRKFFSRILTEKRLQTTRQFFEKHGSKTIFAARFIAGVRMPAFFIAGSMGVPYRVFFSWNLLGGLISCPTSIYLAYKFGPVAEEWLKQSKVWGLVIIGLLAFCYAIFHFAWKRRKRPELPVVPQDPATVAGVMPTLGSQDSASPPAKVHPSAAQAE